MSSMLPTTGYEERHTMFFLECSFVVLCKHWSRNKRLIATHKADDLICKDTQLEHFQFCGWAVVLSRNAPHRTSSQTLKRTIPLTFRTSCSAWRRHLLPSGTTDAASWRTGVPNGSPAQASKQIAMAVAVAKSTPLGWSNPYARKNSARKRTITSQISRRES